MDDLPINRSRQHYIALWKEMLAGFLGWSEAQVLKWVEATWNQWLNDNDDLLYYEPPAYWVLPLLIPAALETRLTDAELEALLARLEEAITDEHALDFPLGTHWQPYRVKVEQVLAEYGEHLP